MSEFDTLITPATSEADVIIESISKIAAQMYGGNDVRDAQMIKRYETHLLREKVRNLFVLLEKAGMSTATADEKSFTSYEYFASMYDKQKRGELKSTIEQVLGQRAASAIIAELKVKDNADVALLDSAVRFLWSLMSLQNKQFIWDIAVFGVSNQNLYAQAPSLIQLGFVSEFIFPLNAPDDQAGQPCLGLTPAGMKFFDGLITAQLVNPARKPGLDIVEAAQSSEASQTTRRYTAKEIYESVLAAHFDGRVKQGAVNATTALAALVAPGAESIDEDLRLKIYDLIWQLLTMQNRSVLTHLCEGGGVTAPTMHEVKDTPQNLIQMKMIQEHPLGLIISELGLGVVRRSSELQS